MQIKAPPPKKLYFLTLPPKEILSCYNLPLMNSMVPQLGVQVFYPYGMGQGGKLLPIHSLK